jgi:hypothetical protein
MWHSPLLKVQRIVVEGNVRVPADVVRDVATGAVFEGNFARALGIDRLFAWPEGELRNLALLPAVARLSLSKSYLSRTVHVQVTERIPVGVWCLPAQCWWFDGEGKLFARAPGGEGGLLKTVYDYSGRTLGTGMAALPPPLMANLLEIFSALREGGAVTGEVRIDDISREEIEVATLNGPRLYFSLRFSLGAAADAVRQVFLGGGQFPSARKLQYVDFRVENRVYYK